MPKRAHSHAVHYSGCQTTRSLLAGALGLGVLGILGLYLHLHYHTLKGPTNTGSIPLQVPVTQQEQLRIGNPKYRGQNRVYCMVPFVWPHTHGKNHQHVRDSLHKNDVKIGSYGPERHAEIMATWGKRCDKVEFFIDRPPGTEPIPDLPDNVISVNMSRFLDSSLDHGQHAISNRIPEKWRYGKHIWEKMWRSWVWVHERRAKDFEWFVKVDDDCFIFPENIRWYVSARGWKPIDAHYFGHKLYHRSSRGVPYTLIAGATVVWSRAALEIAASSYRQMPKYEHHGPERGYCEDRPQASEEVSTARCLLGAGVTAESARDELNREMVLLFHPGALMFDMARPPRGHRDEGWYWKNKPETTTTLHECCSTRPISLHAMKGDNNLLMLDRFFYNGTTFDEINRVMNKKNKSVFNEWLLQTRGNLSQVSKAGLNHVHIQSDVGKRPVANSATYTNTHNQDSLVKVKIHPDKTRRYVIWNRNSGNLNNQLISAAAAFDTALSLNRTVFIELEARLMEVESRSWRYKFLGIEDNLWDIDRLKAVYSIEFESDSIKKYGSLDAHPIIGSHLYDPACKVPILSAHATQALIQKFHNSCVVINLGGEQGQLRFAEEFQSHGFFSVFRPAPYLVKAADKWLASIDWKTSSGLPAMSVHSRSFWESRRCSNAYEFCSGKVRHQLNHLMKPKSPIHSEVASTMCFVTPNVVNLVLKRSRLSSSAIVNCSNNDVQCRPWFLASDGQSANIIEDMATEYGAYIFDLKTARLRGDLDRLYRSGKVHGVPWRTEIQRLEGPYLDIYLLTKGKIFLGNVYSTFSSTVCKMRTPREPSNVCQLLTTHKLDPFVQSLLTEGLPKGWNLPWIGTSDKTRRIIAQANTKRGGIKCV